MPPHGTVRASPARGQRGHRRGTGQGHAHTWARTPQASDAAPARRTRLRDAHERAAQPHIRVTRDYTATETPSNHRLTALGLSICPPHFTPPPPTALSLSVCAHVEHRVVAAPPCPICRAARTPRTAVRRRAAAAAAAAAAATGATTAVRRGRHRARRRPLPARSRRGVAALPRSLLSRRGRRRSCPGSPPGASRSPRRARAAASRPWRGAACACRGRP